MTNKVIFFLIFLTSMMANQGLYAAKAPRCSVTMKSKKADTVKANRAKEVPRRLLEQQVRFLSELPLDQKEWQNTYRSFSEIAEKDSYFYKRIKRAFKKVDMAFNRKDYKKLLGFSDRQNERFRDVFSQNPKDFFFFGLESSYLKLLNDKVIGKENATSLNFFNKLIFMTHLIDVSATNSPQLLREINRQWIKESDSSRNFLEQNDFKTLRLALNLENFSNQKGIVDRIFKSAYQRHKDELHFLLKVQYPELQSLFDKNLPESIGVENLYNGLIADKLWELQRGMTEVREIPVKEGLVHYSKGRLKVRDLVIKRITEFYKLHDQAIVLIASNPKLVQITAKGEAYASPMFFKIMKNIATQERSRSNKKAEDSAYFTNIKNVLNQKFEIKVSTEEARSLVAYYQNVQRNIPPMLFVRTEPLLAEVSLDTFIISGDRINGSGLEMSMVTKHLAEAKNQGIIEQTRASQNGVDETTLLLEIWANKLTKIVRKSYISIKFDVNRSGDDVNFVASRAPTPKENALFYENLSAEKDTMDSSRITMGVYKKHELIQERVEDLEKVQKTLDKAFYYIKSHDTPELPSFNVIRTEQNGSKVELMDKTATEEQIYYLKELIKDPEIKFDIPVEYSPQSSLILPEVFATAI